MNVAEVFCHRCFIVNYLAFEFTVISFELDMLLLLSAFLRLLRFLLFGRCSVAVVVVVAGVGAPAGVTVRVRARVRVIILFRHSQRFSCS